MLLFMVLMKKKDDDVQKKIFDILAVIEEKPYIEDCCIVEKAVKYRPIKITMSCSDHANQLLRKCKELPTKEGFKSIYICPDRSFQLPRKASFQKAR